MSALKKIMKKVWAFKWCRVWITANNLKCVAGNRCICLGWFIIMDIFWRNKYFKAPGRNASIFSSRERTCGNKRQKMPYYNLLEYGAWAYYVSRLRSSVSIIVLKICFSFLHFFAFCYISWATLCHVAFSDYYESILFFHVCSSALQISTKLAVDTAQWRGQMYAPIGR